MGAYFQRGAYFHGVLINTCNFLVARSCVGRVILGLEGLFLLISVQCVWFFYNQRYSQQSIDHCQPLPTNVKHLEPMNLYHGSFFLLIPGFVLPRGLA